jgi:hypothetical protein
MSSRFHSKFHRHNHHTTPIEDARYPDAAHDPIASYDSPFQGDFILNGTLSANDISLIQPNITPGEALTASVSSLNIIIDGQTFKIPLLV